MWGEAGELIDIAALAALRCDLCIEWHCVRFRCLYVYSALSPHQRAICSKLCETVARPLTLAVSLPPCPSGPLNREEAWSGAEVEF